MERIEGIGLAVYERVANNNCDMKGRLKPAATFRMLTELAGINVTLLGMGPEDLYAQNLFWVLSRMKVKFLRMPVAEEMLFWRTWPKGIQQKLFFTRDFEAFDAEKQPVIMATSLWLVIDAIERRLVPATRMPHSIPAMPHLVAIDEPLEKLPDFEGQDALTVTARYSDIDMQGHVNNTRYVEAISDALPYELMTERDIDWIQVNYDKEVRPQESLTVRMAEDASGLWHFEGFNLSTNQEAFKAQLQFKAINTA